MGTLRAISVSLLLGLAACPADDGSESTNTSDGTSSMASTGSGSSASGATTMSSASGSGATDDATSSSGEGSTTEVATGPVTSGSSSSSGSSEGDPTGGGAACDPDAQDHPCLECFVDDCCKSWTMCLADEGCTCVVDCHVIKGGSLGSCESQCNSDGELYEALFFCGQMYCLGTCEWDCC